MVWYFLVLCSMLLAAATAFDCTTSAFEAILPSNTSVILATPLADNATFNTPASDTGFPSSPTGLRALCAVQVEVPAPGNTTYNFGIFLPSNWNGRFL